MTVLNKRIGFFQEYLAGPARLYAENFGRQFDGMVSAAKSLPDVLPYIAYYPFGFVNGYGDRKPALSKFASNNEQGFIHNTILRATQVLVWDTVSMLSDCSGASMGAYLLTRGKYGKPWPATPEEFGARNFGCAIATVIPVAGARLSASRVANGFNRAEDAVRGGVSQFVKALPDRKTATARLQTFLADESGAMKPKRKNIDLRTEIPPLYDAARLALKEGLFDNAITGFEKILDLEMTVKGKYSPATLTSLAEAVRFSAEKYSGKQRIAAYEKADAVLCEALKLDPENVKAWAEAGRLFKERGIPKDAEKAFTRAIDLANREGSVVQPTHLAYFHYDRAGIRFFRLGDMEGALGDVLRAIQITETLMSPRSVFHVLLGRIKRRKGQLKESVNSFLSAEQLEIARDGKPKAVTVHELAKTYRVMDRSLQARTEFARAKSLGWKDR